MTPMTGMVTTASLLSTAVPGEPVAARPRSADRAARAEDAGRALDDVGRQHRELIRVVKDRQVEYLAIVERGVELRRVGLDEGLARRRDLDALRHACGLERRVDR